MRRVSMMTKLSRAILLLSFVLGSARAFAAGPVVMSWADCVREAARTNPDLAASRENVQQRKAETWVAASPFLPQITSEASASRLDNISGGGRRDNNTYSVRANQLLFDGFKTYDDYKTAQENVKASEFSSTVTSADVRFNLRQAFVDLLRAQTLVPITSGIIERREQNLAMIRLRYESGREHEGALLLAEADVASARFEHSRAKRGVSAAQYALRKAMGWYDDAPLRVEGRFELSGPIGTRPDLRMLADGHPAVGLRSAEKGAAHYELKAAEAEFFPTFDVSAEVGKVRSGGFTGSDNGWMVGVGATLPIFEGGRRIANTQRAKAKVMEAGESERAEYDRVLAGLEAAWQDLSDAEEYYRVQRKFLEANEVRAKIARAQYANGLLIFDNWIIIEDNYVRSQIASVEAGAAMLVAEAEWVRTKGEALTYE